MKNQTKPITKAIFPVAGLGTRFFPITKSSPKEMLPIVNKPLIKYAFEEAYASGIYELFIEQTKNRFRRYFPYSDLRPLYI